MSFPNLGEQGFPVSLFIAQFSEELSFVEKSSHVAFLSFGTVCANFPQISTKSRKKSLSERGWMHFILLRKSGGHSDCYCSCLVVTARIYGTLSTMRGATARVTIWWKAMP